MIRLSGQRALINLQVVALDQDTISWEKVTWGRTSNRSANMVELDGKYQGHREREIRFKKYRYFFLSCFRLYFEKYYTL